MTLKDSQLITPKKNIVN